MSVSAHSQDDLLIGMALSRLEYQFRSAEPRLAARAWTLAVAIADQHGLEPADAIRQLERVRN